MKIYSKPANSSTSQLWGAEINGKKGYVPKTLVRESKILNKPTVEVDEEPSVGNNVPSATSEETPQDDNQIGPSSVQQPYEVIDGTTLFVDDAIKPSVPQSPVQATVAPGISENKSGSDEPSVVTAEAKNDTSATEKDAQNLLTSENAAKEEDPQNMQPTNSLVDDAINPGVPQLPVQAIAAPDIGENKSGSDEPSVVTAEPESDTKATEKDTQHLLNSENVAKKEKPTNSLVDNVLSSITQWMGDTDNTKDDDEEEDEDDLNIEVESEDEAERSKELKNLEKQAQALLRRLEVDESVQENLKSKATTGNTAEKQVEEKIENVLPNEAINLNAIDPQPLKQEPNMQHASVENKDVHVAAKKEIENGEASVLGTGELPLENSESNATTSEVVINKAKLPKETVAKSAKKKEKSQTVVLQDDHTNVPEAISDSSANVEPVEQTATTETSFVPEIIPSYAVIDETVTESPSPDAAPLSEENEQLTNVDQMEKQENSTNVETPLEHVEKQEPQINDDQQNVQVIEESQQTLEPAVDNTLEAENRTVEVVENVQEQQQDHTLNTIDEEIYPHVETESEVSENVSQSTDTEIFKQNPSDIYNGAVLEGTNEENVLESKEVEEIEGEEDTVGESESEPASTSSDSSWWSSGNIQQEQQKEDLVSRPVDGEYECSSFVCGSIMWDFVIIFGTLWSFSFNNTKHSSISSSGH